MAEIFKPGDKVVLISGGPTMAVESVSAQTAVCVWIDKNKTFREPFGFVVLKKYENPYEGLGIELL